MTTTRVLAVGLLLILTSAACSRKPPEQVVLDRIQQGDVYFKQKRYFEASVEYRGALQANPRHGLAHKKLAETYTLMNSLQSAFDEYRQAAVYLPNDAEAQLAAGNLNLLAGRLKDAEGRARQVLKRDPGNIEALRLLGASLSGQKISPEIAIARMQKAIDVDPNQSGVFTALGALQLATGRQSDAEAAFRKGVEVAPTAVRAHMNLAYFLWGIGEFADAEQEFTRAYRLDPKDVSANRALAALTLGAGRIREAEPHLKMLAETSGSAEDRINLADYYAATRRPALAKETLQPLMTRGDRYQIMATLRMAAVEFSGGNRKRGHELVDRVLDEFSTDPFALLVKARFLAADNRVDEAIARARKAITAEPAADSGYFVLGNLFERKSDTLEAIKAYEQATKLNPRAIVAQVRLANLYLELNDPESAVTVARAAIDNQPANGDLYVLLARALIANGDLKSAAAELDRLVKAYPRAAAVQTQLGVLRASQRNPADAMRSFEQALSIDPNDLEALTGLLVLESRARTRGVGHRRLEERLAATPKNPGLLTLAARTYATDGETTRAERALQMAIEANPSNMVPYGLLGQLYVSIGKLDDAATQYEKAIAQHPRSIPALTMSAIIMEAQNKQAEATARYERILEIDPQAGVAANNLAWQYVEYGAGDLKDALKLAQDSRKRFPGDANVIDTLGWIYFKMGELNNATEALEASVKADASPLHLFHLGMTYLARGDKVRARQTLERSVARGAEFPGSARAKHELDRLNAIR